MEMSVITSTWPFADDLEGVTVELDDASYALVLTGKAANVTTFALVETAHHIVG